MCLDKFLLTALLWSFSVGSELQCKSPSSSNLKFSIVSHRNKTGHWISQVKLKPGASKTETGPWKVDVDHTIERCEDEESVTLIATVTGSLTSARKPPAPGYDLVPGLGYYKLHTDVKTWHEALKTCDDEGAHLAVINSEEEAKALGPFWDMSPKILEGPQNDWAHVGFHDLYREGEYLTIFNQTLVGAGYVKWYAGDPHGVNQNCGIVVRRENLLADIGCTAKQPFFCEKEL